MINRSQEDRNLLPVRRFRTTFEMTSESLNEDEFLAWVKTLFDQVAGKYTHKIIEVKDMGEECK